MTASSAVVAPSGGQPLDSYDLMQVLLGASHISAGDYPPAQHRESGFFAARSLREMDLTFVDAQIATDPKSTERRVRMRMWVNIGMGVVAIALLAGCIGAGWAWMAASDAARAGTSGMPRAEWRIVEVNAGVVTVRIGDRNWPVRRGEVLPNGERIVMIDDANLAVTTESGTFRLAVAASRPTPAQEVR